MNFKARDLERPGLARIAASSLEASKAPGNASGDPDRVPTSPPSADPELVKLLDALISDA